MPFMPLDTARLLDSDLFALSTGDEFKAALSLWCKAWQQVPASSLPADERVLAHLAGVGSKWAKLREVAMRGFVKCADGRFYHPVIAEKALEAWNHRQAQRARAAKRWTPADAAAMPRHNRGAPDADPPAHAAADAAADAAALPRQSAGNARDSKGTVIPKGKVKSDSRAQAPRDARKTAIADDFSVSERVQQWALEHDISRLPERFDHFVGKVRANGYRYVDWDAALMSACRDDWAAFNGSKALREEALARKLAGARNMDILTGKVPHGSAINGTAERVGETSLRTLSDDLRDEDGRPLERHRSG